MSIAPQPRGTGPSNQRPEGDHPYWRVGDEERHFNTIQAGLRALGSGWLLATFGAAALLLRRTEGEDYWIPAEWLLVTVCVMGATGLALLWLIDQLVYHRLLNAAFLLCLKMEHDDPTLPPLRHLMMVASGNVGMARLLSLFYAVPIAGLTLVASGVATYNAASDELSSTRALLSALALIGVALLPLALLVFIHHQRPERTLKADADVFGDPSFTQTMMSGHGAVVRRFRSKASVGQSSGERESAADRH
jgi:hypothetical protein